MKSKMQSRTVFSLPKQIHFPRSRSFVYVVCVFIFVKSIVNKTQEM